MAVEIACTSCKTKYKVGEQILGKTVKCKNCGFSFVAEAIVARATPVKKPVAILDDDQADDTPRPVAKRIGSAKSAIKANIIEDDFDEDAPAQRRSKAVPAKKSSALLFIVGGVFGLLMLGGIGVAAVVLSGVLDSDKKEIVNATGNPASSQVQNDNNSRVPPLTDAPGDDSEARNKAHTTTEEPNKSYETTKEPDNDTKKKPLLLPSSKPEFIKSAPTPVFTPGKTTPDQATIERVKRATVYIEVEDDEGQSSGTGWFGLENNLIFTNAHVVGMIAPSAPKPKKVTIYVNSGTPQERVIPHSRLEILVVDRYADLAVIRVLNEKDLPTPLTIRMSEDLKDLAPLVVVGFPGGRRLQSIFSRSTNAPKATLATSSFSSNLYDQDGNLWTTQIRGGAGQGNSGGPVVDVDGNVVCLIVRGVRSDTRDAQYQSFMNWCVPTEFVAGLMSGRVADVEYGTAYMNNGKVNIPVRLNILDPYNRLKEAGIAVWIGENSKKPRSPGQERTGMENSDSNYKEFKLNYKWNKDTQYAEGTVELPELPSGQVYWGQPYYSNSLTAKYYNSGLPIKMSGPPVSLEEVDLFARYKLNSKRSVTLTSSSAISEYEIGTDPEPSRDIDLPEVRITGIETVEKGKTSDDMAMLRINYNKLEFIAKGLDGEKTDVIGTAMPKPIRDIINKNIKLIQGFGFVNKFGEIYKIQQDVRATQATIPVLERFSSDVMEALQNANITMPNKRMKPGETWEVKRNFRLQVGFVEEIEPKEGTPERPNPQPGQPRTRTVVREYKYVEDFKYKYIGTRVRLGSSEAVVEIEADIKPAPGSDSAASGKIKGLACIDLDTGTVLYATMKKDFKLDTSINGVKKFLIGNYNFSVTRGTALTN